MVWFQLAFAVGEPFVAGVVGRGGASRLPPAFGRRLRANKVRAPVSQALIGGSILISGGGSNLVSGEALYPMRWKIERAFFDLKLVLKLERFYTANPNGVAMQLYATTMVYNAFRVAQGRIAQQHGIAPEAISPAKLFPKLAEASSNLAGAEQTVLGFRRLNRGVKLREPNLLDLPLGRTTLQAILVRERVGHRRKRYFVHGRRLWKSLAHVSGGQKLTKLT